MYARVIADWWYYYTLYYYLKALQYNSIENHSMMSYKPFEKGLEWGPKSIAV